MFNFYITIDGSFDSRELYNKIKQYKINMLDVGNKTMIQGNTNYQTFLQIIIECHKYSSKISIDIV